MVNVATGVRKTFLVMILALVLWLGMQVFVPVYAGEDDSESILVKFVDNVSDAERDAVIRQMNGVMVRWIDAINTAQIRIVNTPALGQDPLMGASSPFVISAELDEFVRGIPVITEPRTANESYAQSTIPPSPVQVNDPDYNNTQRVYAPQLLGLSNAWRFSMGQSKIIVAVVDSGVNAEHPDLAGRIMPGYDFVNNDANPADDHGHGTHVAGIISANANNGIGSVGICPSCSILPVKVLDSGNVGTWSNVATGIIYAADNGARVINLSLGGNSNTQVIQDSINYAVAKGVLIVAAAGNSRTNTPFYPAALENVMAVSATRQDDSRWSLSNYGDWIDISAPGYAIFSTFYDLSNFYGGYTFMSGTSMASPHIAGVAGLLFSQQPNRTVAEVRTLLQSTALDLGTPGFDPEFGHGRVNAGAALEAGAPQPVAKGVLGGTVWEDTNVDGLWASDEKAGNSLITIHITQLDGKLITTTSVNGSGEWRVENLYAGVYKVSAEASGRLILTTQREYTVELPESQTILNLHFGTISAENIGSNRVYVPTVTR